MWVTLMTDSEGENILVVLVEIDYMQWLIPACVLMQIVNCIL